MPFQLFPALFMWFLCHASPESDATHWLWYVYTELTIPLLAVLRILPASEFSTGGTMTTTRKMLLGTAAATIAVTGGVSTGAMAADAMLKKAPPIQYVRICDRYGYGFFQIPGSSICLQLRGQLQSDNAYQPTHDLVFLASSKAGGASTPPLSSA